MGSKTIKALIGGKTYEIKPTMSVLRMAEEISGISLPEAMVNGMGVGFVQGILYAGLKQAGVDVTYEQVGEMSDFAETRANYMAVIDVMHPDVEDEPAKNETVEGPKKSRGKSSSATGMDSSN